MIIYPNVGFIGFPLLQSLFGKQSLLLTALINMPFNLSLFTLGMMIMSNNKSFQIKTHYFCTYNNITNNMELLLIQVIH